MDPMTGPELLKLLDTVLSAAKKAEAESPADRDRAVDGLNALSKAMVTTAVLAETQAGKRVRTLTKHSDAKISAAASKVVSTWKDMVRRESTGGEKAVSGATSGPPSRAPSSAALADSQATAERQQSIPEPGSQATTAAAIDPSEIPNTGDTVRDKIRVNLVQALQKALSEGAEAESSVIDIGVAVELALYAEYKGVTPAYKNKFRQLHFNLKDDKNPDLRRRVIEGVISPEILITLAPEELASDAKREENDRIREKKLFDAAPSSVKLATTDQFQCGKCKQRKTTYYQMQTRSADEPMTTFVRCVNCGNAWKFC